MEAVFSLRPVLLSWGEGGDVPLFGGYSWALEIKENFLWNNCKQLLRMTGLRPSLPHHRPHRWRKEQLCPSSQPRAPFFSLLAQPSASLR